MSDTHKHKLPQLFDLTDRVAVVTGGAGLLGAEFCHTLAEACARIVIADLDEASAAHVADDINRHGGSAISLRVDVTDRQSVAAMVEATMKAYDRLDILVNSAALDPKFDPQHGGHTNVFEDYPLDLWNRALSVNLTGAFLCCQAAGRVMLAQGGGVMINMSSIYGITAPDQRLYQKPGEEPAYKPAYYPVTKTGILGLTTYLAAYYAGKNIRVNAISPGGVFNGHDEAFVKAYSAKTVMGRMAYKDDMNGALIFLASDASAYVTGANIIVDGGWSVW
ncbi:MAG: SDR family oxidoreductase [Anaerolineales bacterium]|nr:SDR family oxidoreductase [Anaerolineales bacterium]